MSSQSRWITLVVAAFVVTLAGLRYLNRDKPVVAFASKATISFGDFWALPFNTIEDTKLVIEVNSTSGIDFSVAGISKEDHEYFMKVNSGKIPKDRYIVFLWKSDAGTTHHSPPILIERGDYILHIENSLSSNTKRLPVNVTVKALEIPSEPK